ncbi:hypothetical protein DXA96_13090 [Lachnospiraceae bacterium OF09-33XD]|nr:hypothetical protein DXA96_13090 [Lachnospiraceae bacterium OF09-33XD]
MAEQAYREYSSENYTGFIDCELVWEKTKEVIQECNSRRPEVQGVCITSFGESVILVDREGRPLGESVLYSAGGVDEQWRELERKIGREKIYQITGIFLILCIPSAACSGIGSMIPNSMEKQPDSCFSHLILPCVWEQPAWQKIHTQPDPWLMMWSMAAGAGRFWMRQGFP